MPSVRIRVLALLFGNFVLRCTAPVTPNDGDSATHDAADDAPLDGCFMRGTDCGMCPSCADAPNARSSCVAGACQLTCNAGFYDCDRRYETGCEAAESVEHCGSCDTRCVVPANSTATCVMSRCGFTCNAGFALHEGACVRFETRPLQPWSGWLAASQIVEFKWVLPPTSTASRLEICSDRACTNVELTQDFAAPVASFMSQRLMPGNHFWKVTVSGPNGLRHQSNVWQVWIPVTHRTPFTGVDRPVVDINGDGWQDIVLCGLQCAWLSNPFGGSERGRLTAIQVLPVPLRGEVSVPHLVGDLDGDGFSDLTFGYLDLSAPPVSQMRVFFGNAIPPASVSVSFSGSGWSDHRTPLSACDLDNDGYADVLATTPDGQLGIRAGSPRREALTTLRLIESTNDIHDSFVQIFQGPSNGRGTQLLSNSRNNFSLGALWEIDYSTTPPTTAQRWDAANTQILQNPQPRRPFALIPLGDLTADGVPESLFARYFLFPPSAVVLAQGGRDARGTVTFRSLSDSIVTVTDDTRAVGVVSPIDLDSNGQPDFVVASESNAYQFADLFVVTGDFRQPNTLRALPLNAGHRDCRAARVVCGQGDGGERARLPVGGDFDKDGYDDVIIPDLDNSRLMILRGGSRIDDLRWEPLMIAISREVISILVS